MGYGTRWSSFRFASAVFTGVPRPLCIVSSSPGGGQGNSAESRFLHRFPSLPPRFLFVSDLRGRTPNTYQTTRAPSWRLAQRIRPSNCFRINSKNERIRDKTPFSRWTATKINRKAGRDSFERGDKGWQRVITARSAQTLSLQSRGSFVSQVDDLARLESLNRILRSKCETGRK